MNVVAMKLGTSLIEAINVNLTKAKDCADQAEKYYALAGAQLKQAKDEKPKGITWPAFVRKHFNLSQQRADELIRIATGKITVEEVRAKDAEKHKKQRRKPMGRPIDPDDDWTEEEIEADLVERGQAPLLKGKEKIIDDFLYLAGIAERVKLLDLTGIKITQQMKKAAKAASEAWNNINKEINHG
jgi:hypothetical protein